MKSLEEAIRDAASRGELNHLSLAHTARGWEVAYRDVKNYRLRVHADPVCALLEALTGKAGPTPIRQRRRGSAKPAPTPTPAKPADDFDDLLG